MKKEFLENLGLTADQIKTIQNESGSEQDKQRKIFEALKTEPEQANAKIKERHGK